MPTRTFSSNPALLDAERRARAQERVAVGLAAVVLVVTAVTATTPVADGMASSVSRTGAEVDPMSPLSTSDDRCHDGVPTVLIDVIDDPGGPIVHDTVCPFGSP